MLVDFATGTVFDQQTTEDSEAAHPHDLAVKMSAVRPLHLLRSPENIIFLKESWRWRSSVPWHTRIRSTLPLTKPTMSSDSPRSCQLSSSRTRVHSDWLSDDEAIRNKLADSLAGVGVRDFVHFVRIEPNLALSAPHHGSSEAFLGTEVDPDRHRLC